MTNIAWVILGTHQRVLSQIPGPRQDQMNK